MNNIKDFSKCANCGACYNICPTNAITVDVVDNEVIVSMHVIVKYGIAINTVADNIISAVNYTIENLTGIKVSWIKFFVEGVRL